MNFDEKHKIEAEKVKLDVVSNPIFDGSFNMDEDFTEEEWEDIGEKIGRFRGICTCYGGYCGRRR